MAEKKGNGYDPGTLAIVEALERIEREIAGLRRETNERLDGMAEDLASVRADVSGLRTELSSLRSETRAEIALHHEELPARVRKLEEAVFKRTGR